MGFVLSIHRFELMISCWNYTAENRIRFLDIHTRLNEILSDNEREQPYVWFSDQSSSSHTVSE